MPDDSEITLSPPERALHERYGTLMGPPAAWNDVLAALLAHRSVRSYLPDALDPGTLELLVAAAQSAATSSNLQVWSVIAIEDPARRERLAQLAGNQRHIAEAPLFLVWLADLSRAQRMADRAAAPLEALPYTESFVMGVVDAALASQNAAVAAESLGLGIVYIGGMRNHPQAVAAELGLPPQVVAVFGMCVGKPNPSVVTDVKPRLPQCVVLHHEQYSIAREAEGIAAYDASLTRFQQKQEMRPVGWSGSILSRLKGPGSLSGRHVLREVLARMGFPLA